MKNIQQIRDIILFILILNSIQLKAQTTDIVDKKMNENSYITVDLLSPVNGLNPRWRVGFIRSINPKWKVGLDIGYGNRTLLVSDFGNEIGNEYKLWEIRPELFYILNPKKKTIKYFSVELFYIHHKDLIQNNSYVKESSYEFISFDQANYFRQKYGANLKYGMMVNLSEKIGFNFYSGLGVRTRDNKYFKIVNPIHGNQPTDTLFLFYNNYRENEGKNVDVNFTLGIKFYFKFKN